MNIKRFPVYKANEVLNKFDGQLSNAVLLKYSNVEIDYPCRLDAMAINPAAVCYNNENIFTPGEVVISTKIFVKVKIKLLNQNGGELLFSEKTRRKVLVKHAYYLMCKALNVNPSLYIEVDDKHIPKHCGFGSSSSIVAAVSSAINELYGKPIINENLIKYLAANHGEEVSDDNTEDLKLVQCIGGGATNGLTKEGIIIIAGRATAIAKMLYEGKILIAIPNDFEQKDATVLMELEENNLWRFKKTGDKFAEKIAYDLLHKALPEMANNKLNELSKIVFDYRFNMGSIENCSFVYEKMVEQAKEIRKLYEDNKCELLSLSSVGPAFFAVVNNDIDKEECRKVFEKLDMNIIETEICNTTYLINKLVQIDNEDYWDEEETVKMFLAMKPSKYITDVIDSCVNKKMEVLDVGCGCGRYSFYIKDKCKSVVAVDKYENISRDVINSDIVFVKSDMSSLGVEDERFDFVLSIGVLHNATDKRYFEKSLNELYRVMKCGAYLLLSVFTDDLITDDLVFHGDNLYSVISRPPMVLYSKEQLYNMFEENSFKVLKVVDEHVTDVGSGKRNVLSVLLVK